MGRLRLVAGALSAALACAIAVFSQTAGTGRAVLYEGARLIVGDERPPIENGAFVVQNGRITAVGREGRRHRTPPVRCASIWPARR